MPPACICVTRLSSSRFTKTSFLIPTRSTAGFVFAQCRNESPNSASTTQVAPCGVLLSPDGFLPLVQTVQPESHREPRSKRPEPAGSYSTSPAGAEKPQCPSGPALRLHNPRPIRRLLQVVDLQYPSPRRGTSLEVNDQPDFPPPSPATQSAGTLSGSQPRDFGLRTESRVRIQRSLPRR